MDENFRSGALRTVLALVFLSHLGIGLTLMIGHTGAIVAVARMYGISEVTCSPQFLYILKPLGAYMLAFALLAGFALRDPGGNRSVIVGIAGLLLLRVLQRLMFGSEAQAAFGITTPHLLAQCLFFVLIAGALLALLPRRT